MTDSTTDVPTSLAHILDRAEAGDEFLVVQDGVPVARILPPLGRPAGAADAALLQHVVAASAGGLDNAAIDADLARAYGGGPR